MRIKLTQEQKEHYAHKKLAGMTWDEIKTLIENDLDIELDGGARTLLRNTIESIGYEKIVLNEVDTDEFDKQEEAKPKIDLVGGGYIIRYGRKMRHSVEISEEALQDLLSLYCIAGLTQEQVAMKKNLTRRELNAILSACDVVKSSIAVTPRQLDELSKEEIAEYYRMQKKKYAMAKYDSLKYKDIEHRVKNMDQKQYWLQLLYDEVNKIDPKKLNVTPYAGKVKGLKIYNVYLTDVHAGLEVKNIFGKYNLQEVSLRIKKLVDHIFQEIPEGSVLNICELGDSIHGIIHGSVKAESAPAIESYTHLIKEYTQMLLTLSEAYEVGFYKVNGSHESLEKSKTDRTEDENFGVAIYEILKYYMKDVKNLTFNDNIEGMNVGLVQMFNYSIALIHGDNTGMQKVRDIDRLFKSKNIIEVNAGHIHHRKVEDFNGITLFYNEPFCATDQYAAKLLLNSESGVRIVEYTKEGRSKEWLLRL